MQPTGIELLEHLTALAITWQDGEVSLLEACVLRHASRAASEIRRKAEGIELTMQLDLRVDAIEPIGNHACGCSSRMVITVASIPARTH
jgi:DUF971 family protein